MEMLGLDFFYARLTVQLDEKPLEVIGSVGRIARTRLSSPLIIG